MDSNGIRTLLQELLGPDGLNMGRVTQPKELTLVKVKTFSGTDKEDPYEWLESFKQTAAANNWDENRWVKIALGYLKGAARDWYLANKAQLTKWEEVNHEETDYQEAYIAPEFKRNFSNILLQR